MKMVANIPWSNTPDSGLVNLLKTISIVFIAGGSYFKING